MGRMYIEGMQGLADMETALGFHLEYNHYPPLPAALVDVCLEAIFNGRLGLWDKPVALPDGYGFKPEVRTGDLIEGCHLETFLGWEEEVSDDSE